MTLRFDQLRSVNVARTLEGWHHTLEGAATGSVDDHDRRTA
jgi:hypothetical protein